MFQDYSADVFYLVDEDTPYAHHHSDYEKVVGDDGVIHHVFHPPGGNGPGAYAPEFWFYLSGGALIFERFIDRRSPEVIGKGL